MNNSDREDVVTLEILEAIHERSDLTQRGLAQRTGVALGLANSYLKRCVRKGLVKIQQAPANRYLYYLTPKGFSEKSRLTAEYLRYSFSFYHKASDSCTAALELCRARDMRRVGLFGISELAEITCLRAVEHDLSIVGMVDSKQTRGGEQFVGVSVSNSVSDVPQAQGWILTDLETPEKSLEQLRFEVEHQCIVVLSILGLGV